MHQKSSQTNPSCHQCQTDIRRMGILVVALIVGWGLFWLVFHKVTQRESHADVHISATR